MASLRRFLAVTLLMSFQGGIGWSQMIVAHRGASHDAPENTLAAFRLAWEQGSDGIEGDFYLTADQQIACIHDRDTERTTGVKRIVEQSTLAQLRGLEYGGWKDPRWRGEAIPTLAEVFATVPPGKTFVIELKSKQAIVPVLSAELQRLDARAIRLLIISFDQQTVAACRQAMPQIPVHWLTSFDSEGEGVQPTAGGIAAIVKQCGAAGVGMKGDREVIDADFIEQLTAAGCPEFHVWTIDAPDDARFFQQLGAIGITTNRPAHIRAALAP
jgi:glycerophosphoryl diester phosphodiesterase